MAALVNHSLADPAVCGLSCRRWRVCDCGRSARRAARRALAIAGPGGRDQPSGGGAVLAWPALAIAATFVRLVCAWAIVTGALLLAAAHRLTVPHGRWLLVLAGAGSAGWGVWAAATEVSALEVIKFWLIGYGVVFGGMLLALAGRLQRQHRMAQQQA
jgi:hypothetical protein